MKPVAWIRRNRKPNKNEDDEELRSDLLQDVPEWLQDFKENPVDKTVQPHQYFPSSSHEFREQKWYRVQVSTVSRPTSGKTEIVTSA